MCPFTTPERSFFRSAGLLWLLLFPLSLSAQEPEASQAPKEWEDVVTIAPFTYGFRTFDNRYKGVKGSPMLFEDWVPGSVITVDTTKDIRVDGINLDVYQQEVWITIRNIASGKTPLDLIRKVTIREQAGERVFRVFPENRIEGGKREALKLYEVLHSGRYRLLKAHDKYLERADYKGAYSMNRTHDTFIDRPKLFLENERGTFQRVRTSRRSLEKALPSRKKEIRRLERKKQWSIEGESDLIRFLRALE